MTIVGVLVALVAIALGAYLFWQRTAQHSDKGNTQGSGNDPGETNERKSGDGGGGAADPGAPKKGAGELLGASDVAAEVGAAQLQPLKMEMGEQKKKKEKNMKKDSGNPHVAAAERSLEQLRALCDPTRDTEHKWTRHSVSNGITIETREAAGGAICVRGTGLVSVPGVLPVSILRVAEDIDRKSRWDSMLAIGETVSTALDGAFRVTYQKFKPVFPTSARDFVSAAISRVDADGTCWLSSCAVDDPSRPPVRGAVRGEVVVGGFQIRTASEGASAACRVVYVAQVDLKGSIPRAIVNSATSKQPACITGISKILGKMSTAERAALADGRHPGEAAPAPAGESEDGDGDGDGGGDDDASDRGGRRAEDGAARADEKGSVFSSPERLLRRRPRSDSSVSVEAAAIEAGSPRHAAFVSVGFKAMTDVLRESDDIQHIPLGKGAKRAPGTSRGWHFTSMEDGVVILRKEVGGTDLLCFMGKGIIPAAPDEVFRFLLEPKNRHAYDKLLKTSLTVDTLDDSTSVLWLHHEAKRCLMTHSRDFCIVQSHGTFDDGARVVAGRSVEHHQCQRDPTGKIVRGFVLSSGWVVRPNGSNGGSTVTYLTQVDVALPPKLVNIVAVRQPLCIAHVRKAFEKMKRK